MPLPGEMSPRVDRQGPNPVVCGTKGRAAREPQGFEQWSCAHVVTAYSSPQTEGFKSFFLCLS